MNAINSPPSLDAAELLNLAMRLMAVSGLYRSSDLRWAAASLLQTSTDPEDQQFIKETVAYLNRQADVQQGFEEQHARGNK